MPTLFAAIPYSWFTFGPWTLIPAFHLFGTEIGPFQVHSFGLLVAIGIFVAFSFGSRYTEKTMGRSGIEFQNFAITLLITGWVCAHLFDVLFYQPQEVAEDPLILLKIWGSISSYGGLFGGIIGAWIWKWQHPDEDFIKWCDVAAMSLTFAWLFGRMGCSSVHDHPGSITDFPLAIQWPDGSIRHDLGFYEFLWWIVICAAVLLLSRKPRPRGFYLAVLPMMYAPVRFLLDFLRVGPEEGGDIRYFGLTPAQYFSIGIFLTGLYFFARMRNKPAETWVQYVPGSEKSSDDDAKYYKSKTTPSDTPTPAVESDESPSKDGLTEESDDEGKKDEEEK